MTLSIIINYCKDMYIEPMEKNDWNIIPQDDNIIRKSKSIQAYWLDSWYEKVKDITFETFLYNSPSDIPDILPFEKCMVRYENKSPKDSELWGPVSTKKELLNMFYTSLRCKTNPGNIFCVRKWTELGDEYRCFWNNGLVAISAELENEPPIDVILEYIKKISPNIFYNRCVFDIAHLLNSNELIFVEFNSWESNSGAHRFNWIEDTEVFYDSKDITVRWLNGEKKVNLIENLKNNQRIGKITDLSMWSPIKPICPSSWLVTDKHIYIANDIWLGRFSLDFKPINWTRGVFRFSNLLLCEDGCIYAEPNYYYYDLTPKKTKSRLLPITVTASKSDELECYKYGIKVINKDTNVTNYIRILDNCDLCL